MAWTETWLSFVDLDSSLNINSGTVELWGNCKLEVYVCTADRLCTNISVRKLLRPPNVELLSVSSRLLSPRKFPQMCITVLYIHPKTRQLVTPALANCTWLWGSRCKLTVCFISSACHMVKKLQTTISVPSIQHSHSTHDVICQLCGRQTVSRVWTSLRSFNSVLTQPLVTFNLSATVNMHSRTDFLKMCTVLSLLKQSYVCLVLRTFSTRVAALNQV